MKNNEFEHDARKKHPFWSLFSCLVFLFCLLFATHAHANTHWKTLATGLDYTDLISTEPSGHVYAFRIDPHYYRLSLTSATEQDKKKASIIDFGLSTHALIAINGGFFDPFSAPLGLRISSGKMNNALRPISWWGIFYTLNNQQAYIRSMKDFLLNPTIDFAIQAGPRLVVNGTIPHLKNDYAPRSALCIDNTGHIIIAITDNMSMTLGLFAQLLSRSVDHNGLGCYNALNLDGGSSSQLYASIGDFRLIVPGFANVADAVIVTAR